MGTTDFTATVAPGADARARYDRFLDGIEHDVRNPLNTLGMALSLLGRGKPSPETVDRGARAIERVTAMTEQWIAFGRVVHGTGLPLRPEGARIDDLIRSVLPAEALEGQTVQLAPCGDGAGRWDVELVRRALRELLHNAVDHGGPGAIVVRAGRSDGKVLVTVESQAPVAEAVRPLLFDPVERAAVARTRPPRGLGLGLFLARAVARAHGGEVSLERADGPTLFRLTLPEGVA